MPICDYCGKDFEAYSIFRCKYCLGNFCSDHRLPPNHNCIEIEYWRGKIPPEGVMFPREPDKLMEVLKKGLYVKPSKTKKDLCKYCLQPFQRYELFICEFCLDSFCSKHKEPRAHACKDYADLTIVTSNNLPSKAVCDYCERSVDYPTQLFKCKYCGMNLCLEHRLPPNHACTRIEYWKVRPPPDELKTIESPRLDVLKTIRKKRTINFLKWASIIFVLIVIGIVIFYVAGVTFSNIEWETSNPKNAFDKINIIRNQYGVNNLTWDEKLYKLAYFRAQDMYNRSYFSHYTPEGKNVNDFAPQFGVNIYKVKGSIIQTGIAENIAKGYYSFDGAIEGWMNSYGHRQNLLNPNYDFGAVACYYDICVYLAY